MAYPNFFTPNPQYAWGGGQAINNIIWVQGEPAAKAYPSSPGSTVMLMDAESDHFYIKTTDTSGMPTLRKFSYKEITNGQPVEEAPVKETEYITREEFEKFKSEYKPHYHKNYKKEDRVNE